MAPNSEKYHISFPRLKYPPTRDIQPKTAQQWIKGKRVLDGAENLWRIHDSLYDLSEFVSVHPGGSQWLTLTKGTDVTEAFETHHLHGVAETLLPKYFVRKTDAPRNSPFTFKADGFYKTLKEKVASKLKEIPKDTRRKSDRLTDFLLASVLLLGPISSLLWSYNVLYGAPLIFLNGFVLSCLIISAHNYLHRADSWRMYIFNISGMLYDDWRISHALSHHLHTNTVQDVEISMVEPYLQFLPNKDKTVYAQMGAFYWPFIYPFILLFSVIIHIVTIIVHLKENKLILTNVIPFLLPLWMWTLTGQPLSSTLATWLLTYMVCSFFFVVFGLTAGHHAHVNFFDGDVPRAEELDWGVYQLDTVVERNETSGSYYRSLTTFGDHALHHLFPTLDHAELSYLYPVLLEHCNKFKLELRYTTFCNALLSKSKQLLRNKPISFRYKKTE